MGIELAKAYVTVSATTQEATTELKKVSRSMDDLARSGSYLAQIEREEADARRRAAAIAENVATATERRSMKQAELNTLMDKGLISEATYNRSLRRLSTEGLQEISSKMSEVGGTAMIMGGLVTAAFGASARSAVMAAGQYEQTMIAFSTMMGSAEKAGGLLSDLTKFAAETPFEMPEIEQVARGMVMFGEDSKSLMDTLAMLGNAASGTSSSFGMLGLVYNQIRGVGKLLTQDFRQLSTRGVISLRDIAKHYKITDAAAQEMISKGKVSFEDFRGIMMELAGEKGTGRFAGMMKKQSESMLGLLSTFSDAWRITMRQVGEEIVPVAKWFVKLGIEAVGAFSGMDSMSKKLIAGTLALGTAFGGLFTTVATGAFTMGKVISAYSSTVEILGKYAEASRAAAIAQGSLNMAMAATPYVLAAVAAALAAMLGYKLGQWLVDNTEKAKKFNAMLAEQKNQLDFEKSVGIDFTGASKQDIEETMNSMEGSIASANLKLKKMEEAWFGNKDAIQLTKDQIAFMTEKLEKAREKMLEFAVSEGIPGMDKQIQEVDESLNLLTANIAGTIQRMEELRAPPKNMMVYDVAEERRRNENLAMYEERLAKMRTEQANETKRSLDLRRQRENMLAEVDEKATEKIKEKTEALNVQADTYGMSEIAAAAYQMKVDKVSDAEIKANVTARERVAALKQLTAQQQTRNKAEEEYAATLLAELRQPSILPSQLTDPFATLGMPDLLDGFDELGQMMLAFRTPAEVLADSFKDLKYQFDSGLLSAELYQKGLDAIGKSATDAAKTPMERLNVQIAELKQLMDAGAISRETYDRSIKNIGMSVTESADKKTAYANKVKELDALLAAGAITQKVYNKAIWEAKKGIDDLVGSSGFADFGAKIQDMLIRSGSSAPSGVVDRFAGIGNPVPFMGDGNGGVDALADPIWQQVKLFIEANKKTDQLIAAVKNPPKQPMVLQ